MHAMTIPAMAGESRLRAEAHDVPLTSSFVVTVYGTSRQSLDVQRSSSAARAVFAPLSRQLLTITASLAPLPSVSVYHTGALVDVQPHHRCSRPQNDPTCSDLPATRPGAA
jgi:hypothetical protein